MKTEGDVLFEQQTLVLSSQFTKSLCDTVVNVVRLGRISAFLLCSRHGNQKLRADHRVIALFADSVQRGGFAVSKGNGGRQTTPFGKQALLKLLAAAARHARQRVESAAPPEYGDDRRQDRVARPVDAHQWHKQWQRHHQPREKARFALVRVLQQVNHRLPAFAYIGQLPRRTTT